LLDQEHELLFLISILLDRHSLAQHNATFAESLYSLRRIPASAPAPGAAIAQHPGSPLSGPETAPSEHSQQLTQSQRSASLILATLVPFLKSKLDAFYFAAGGRYAADANAPGGGQSAFAQRQASGDPEHGHREAWERARAAALRWFVKLYPFLHATHEGVRFVYQLLYLLGRSPYFSPELHLAGVRVMRLTGQQALAEERRRLKDRTERLQRVRSRGGRGALGFGWLQEGFLKASYAVADHTRTALIGAVFAFKLLEWWYVSGEQKLGGGKALPPPPPPPALPRAPNGIRAASDPSVCSLCRRKRTNPAMIATSGYVFCYPCAYKYVEQHSRCPVTFVPTRLDHIRRLYQGEP
jgi:peroxin-12